MMRRPFLFFAILSLNFQLVETANSATVWLNQISFTRYNLLNVLNCTDQWPQIHSCLSSFPSKDPVTGSLPRCYHTLQLCSCLLSVLERFEHGTQVAVNLTLVYIKGYSKPCSNAKYRKVFNMTNVSNVTDEDAGEQQASHLTIGSASHEEELVVGSWLFSPTSIYLVMFATVLLNCVLFAMFVLYLQKRFFRRQRREIGAIRLGQVGAAIPFPRMAS